MMSKLPYRQPKSNSCLSRVGSKNNDGIVAANSKQIQAKHEMAMLVTEQTAEDAKTVHQGNSGFQTHTSGSIFDQAAQRTVLSVFVLSMQSMGFSEQRKAAGATEEDVKKISQVMAQTVRKQETGNAASEPGPEAHSLPCEVVGSDEEFSNGVCVLGFSKMDTEGQDATRRSL